ncbi:MAG: VPLPA-CTERM sorting domain-containing protein [Planctomycetales bacterium]|nr:VPLPA-CTERM sorting domain-containing protein [Planctomycetales bacterium]
MICRRLFGTEMLQRGFRSAVAALVLIAANSASAQVYFSEDFEGLDLQPPEMEAIPDDNPRDNVWSPTGPAGWTVDNSQTPVGGMTEWRGWNFVDPIWWNEVAGQDRANFATDIQGFVVAVADGDEWDDAPHDPGNMLTLLSTPSIPLTGISNGTSLEFNTSWRPESPQIGTISASFDGGAPVEILRYESNDLLEDGSPNPFYQSDLNDFGGNDVSVAVDIPTGAQDVVFTWSYSGGNNWWWAIDNIGFGDYFEDFEEVELGTNVMEGRANALPFDPDAVFTHEGPTGWTVDNDGVPFIDEDGIGVTEWKGWSFADKNFWALVAGDQNRTFFTKGEGTVAIADPDEWDDAGSPRQFGEFYNTLMSSPAFDITGAEAGSLTLTLDSSWRPECCDDNDGTNDQTAVISVSYDGGTTYSEVLRFESNEASDFYHPDAENETLAIALNNPAGATSAMLRFDLLNAGNDWWWAIDNLLVSGGAGGLRGDFNNDGILDASDINALTAAAAAGGNAAEFDLTGDNLVDASDIAEWIHADDIFKSYIGDANLDKEFNTSDLVTLFSAGTYENGAAAVWTTGDFTGDGLFTTSDLVAALSDGGYENGPRAAVSAVPEPASVVLTLLGACGALGMIRRRTK